MESIYEICFYGGLILAILLVIVSVILFIVLKIPKVFGELTGRSARKGIRDIREGASPERSAVKKEQAKYYNQGTGKIKARETKATDKDKRKENRDDTTDLLRPELGEEATEVLQGGAKYNDIAVTEVLSDGETDEATDVLAAEGADEATDVLVAEGADEATDVLASGGADDATNVLVAEGADDATDLLTSDRDMDAPDGLGDAENEDLTMVLTSDMTDELSRKVKVYYNIVVTHTDEAL